MGFLNDLTPGLDWNEGVSDPNRVAEGKHHAFVYNVKVMDLTARGKGKSLVITYKMAEDDAEKGKTVDEWRGIPAVTADGKFATDKDATNASWLKRRLQDLGVPEDKINTIEPNDLVGTEVYVTFKNNGQYQNVAKCEVVGAGGQTASSASAASISDLI